MDAELVQDWIMAGNSAAMDWYAMMHDQPLPSQSILERTIGTDFGPISPQFGIGVRNSLSGSQVLIGGIVVLGLLWLMFRKA